MTVKRFTHKINQLEMQFICYDDKAELLGTFADTKGVSNIVELLNELHEDNQLLHKMNADAIDFMYNNFDLSIIFTDRELNDICNEMGWELSEKGIKIDQLEKENEQLKKDIEYYKTEQRALFEYLDKKDDLKLELKVEK